MTAKIICLASPKGGSGKTMLTCSFGTFLAALNKRVLLIDTDIATTGLSLLFLKELSVEKEIAFSQNKDPKGIYDCSLSQSMPTIISLSDNLDLIPASYEFFNDENIGADNFKSILKQAIKNLRDNYDFIFLDAQAGADESAEAATSKEVSDEVVIVTEYDPMSAAGVERLKGVFRKELTYNRTWVLLNKVLPEFVKSFSDFLEVAKYLSPIPWDPEVVRAYARRRIALDMKRGNEHTLAIMQTLSALLGDDVSDEINEWKKNRSESMLTPINEQYEDIKIQLQGIIESQERQKHSELSRTKFIQIFSFLIGASGTAVVVYTIYNLFPSSLKDFPLEILSGISIAFLGYAAYTVMFSLKKNTRSTIDKLELEREKSRLEEKLNRLEALKEADIETLLKSKK